MKFFASSMLASAVTARGGSGGIIQGNPNKSVGGSHGYGYNLGNTYEHGDSHGHYLGHQNGYDDGYPQPSTGTAYTANDFHDHIFGYDSVQPLEDDDWAAVAADQTTIRGLIDTAIDAA